MKERLKVGNRVSCVIEGIFPNFISLSFRSAGVIYRGVLLNETCSTVKRVIPQNYYKEKQILQQEVTDSLYSQVNDRELNIKSKGLRSKKSKQACLVLDDYVFETDQPVSKKDNDKIDKHDEKTEKSIEKSPIDSLFGLVESIDKNVGKPTTFNENKPEKPKAKSNPDKPHVISQQTASADRTNEKIIHKKDFIARAEVGKSDTKEKRITLDSFFSVPKFEDEYKTIKDEAKRERKRKYSKGEDYSTKNTILETLSKQGVSTPPSKKIKQEESPSSVASTPDEKRKRKKIKKLTYDPKQRRRMLKIAEKSLTTDAIVNEDAIPIVKIDVKKIIRKKVNKQKRIDPITLALKNIKNREKTRRRLRMSVMTRKALNTSPNDLLRKAERKPMRKSLVKKKKKTEETKESRENDNEDFNKEDVAVSSSTDENLFKKEEKPISEEDSISENKEKKKTEVEKQKETEKPPARHNTRSTRNIVSKPLLSLQREASAPKSIIKHSFGTRSSSTKIISTTRSGTKFLSTPKTMQKPIRKKVKPKISAIEEKVKDSNKPAQSTQSSTSTAPTSSTTSSVSVASNPVSPTSSHISIESNEIDLLCHEKVESPESEILHPPQRKNRRKPLQVFKSLPNPATATNVLDNNVYRDLNDYTTGIVRTESKSLLDEPKSESETQVFPKLKRSDAELYGIDSLSSDKPYKITITRMNRPTLIPRRFLDNKFTPSYQTFIQKPVSILKPSPMKHLQKPGSMLTCHVEIEKPASDASSTTSSTVTLDEPVVEESKEEKVKEEEEESVAAEDESNDKKVTSKQPAKPKKRKKQAIFDFQETLKPLTRSNADIRLGDIVWGRVFGYGWWPGKVLSKVRDAESNEKRVFCAWMGSNTNSTMNVSDLELFLPNFEKRFDVKKSSQSYTKAVVEAQHCCSIKYGLK